MANGIQVLPPSLSRGQELRFGLIQGLQNFSNERGIIQQRQVQQQALQGLGSQFGLNLPQGLNPQLAALLIGNAQQAALSPQAQQPGFSLSPGQQRFGPGGQPIASVPSQAVQRPGFTLGQGQTRFGPGGQPIASVEATPVATKPRAGALQVAGVNDPSGFAPGTVFQADPTGKVTVLSEPGGAGLSGADKTKIAVTQSKEFRDDERVKNLNIIERSERGMKAALKQSKTAKSRIASDQALGVLFQKMLDPTSVVRESEFARTPQGAALINQIKAIAPKLIKGGLKITDDDRQALVDMAQKLLNEAKITANQAFSEFSTRAKQIGLNEKIVFGGRKPFDLTATQGTTAAPGLTSELQRVGSKLGLNPTKQQSSPARLKELERIDAEIAELEARQ